MTRKKTIREAILEEQELHYGALTTAELITLVQKNLNKSGRVVSRNSIRSVLSRMGRDPGAPLARIHKTRRGSQFGLRSRGAAPGVLPRDPLFLQSEEPQDLPELWDYAGLDRPLVYEYRRNMDEDLRRVERSGDKTRLLFEKLRAGKIVQAQIEYAAALGDPASKPLQKKLMWGTKIWGNKFNSEILIIRLLEDNTIDGIDTILRALVIFCERALSFANFEISDLDNITFIQLEYYRRMETYINYIKEFMNGELDLTQQYLDSILNSLNINEHNLYSRIFFISNRVLYHLLFHLKFPHSGYLRNAGRYFVKLADLENLLALFSDADKELDWQRQVLIDLILRDLR